LVADVALGAAIGEIQRQEAERAGTPMGAEYRRVLASAPADDLRHIREVAAGGRQPNRALAPTVVKVLVGIAACRDEDWRPLLDLAAPQPPRARRAKPPRRTRSRQPS
jgi:hypothetical protein